MSTQTQKQRKQIRQGDVLLTPIAAPPNPRRVTDAEGRPLAGVRIAGERTGHAHELAARVYDDGDRRVVFLERPEVLTHQEHRHIEVPAGWWEVRLQREHVPARGPAMGPARRYD